MRCRGAGGSGDGAQEGAGESLHGGYLYWRRRRRRRRIRWVDGAERSLTTAVSSATSPRAGFCGHLLPVPTWAQRQVLNQPEQSQDPPARVVRETARGTDLDGLDGGCVSCSIGLSRCPVGIQSPRGRCPDWGRGPPVYKSISNAYRRWILRVWFFSRHACLLGIAPPTGVCSD